MEDLDVYLYNLLAGRLSSDKGRMAFQYLPEYLHAPDAKALSFSMPLRIESYGEEQALPFFSNLLPDESVRTRIAEILRVSPENTFGLLKEIGEDCAGAVALYHPGKSPETSLEPVYLTLSDDEADAVLSNLKERPLNVGAKDFHISGAGAQDKLVASIEKGKVRLPLKGTPSTHIIKPGIERIPESIFNEYFCMKLAAECDLNVAKCDILKIKDNSYYVTERYDRVKNAKVWTRLHQEDFCQLLGYDPKIKYESEGGPKLSQCFELLRKMELSASDTLAFLDLLIFNFLIGNGDAHAKNFSVIYQGRHPQLAPAYDLLSTAVYPNIAQKFAMKIDGEYNFRWITQNKFIRMGEKAGLSKKIVVSEIQKISRNLKKASALLVKDLNRKHPSDIYEKIHGGIVWRIAQIKE